MKVMILMVKTATNFESLISSIRQSDTFITHFSVIDHSNISYFDTVHNTHGRFSHLTQKKSNPFFFLVFFVFGCVHLRESRRHFHLTHHTQCIHLFL
jgi:hypothetical protein